MTRPTSAQSSICLGVDRCSIDARFFASAINSSDNLIATDMIYPPPSQYHLLEQNKPFSSPPRKPHHPRLRGELYDCFCNNKRMSPISLSLSFGLLSATKSVSTVNASGVNLGGKTHAFLRNHTKENATCVEGVSVYEMLFEGLGGPNSKLCGLFRVYPISN